MEKFFSGNVYKPCESWISAKLDEGVQWSAIKTLCVDDEHFDEALFDLIENELWPEDLDKETWNEYVNYYYDLHPAIKLGDEEGVVGIDKEGFYNDFNIPSGVASTWERYKNSLAETIGGRSIGKIEKSCHWILNHLKEETRTYGPVKGLVTGSVQSGKTANMAGLISMAADCNWNFFIILSGSIDNLRIQTRDRFRRDLKSSEGVTWRVIDFAGEDKRFSEAELNLNPLGQKPFATRYVTVCLKNKTRLKNLIDWLYEDEIRAQKLRIVVIDDEADQASINTAEITPEEEQERKGINQLIVNLVNGRRSDGSVSKVKFQAMNYISYTATPYANVLNEGPGESLYPKDFICTLPESTEYFGAKVIFGNDEKDIPGMGVVRNIPLKDERQLKKIQKNETIELPESFKESLGWFMCISALIRMKPHSKKRNISMLIHTSAALKAHFYIYTAVGKWLENIEEVLWYCEKTYNLEKHKVTKENLEESNPDYAFINDIDENYPDFNSLKDEIISLLSDVHNIYLDQDKNTQYGAGIHLCVDNYRADREAEDGTKLRIVYPDENTLQKLEKDPVFIVIGGNTLSRGLTIEGLICSYFARNSNQADTLMQMARWFGYRKGVELLQRIWMTSKVQAKFEALSKIDMDMKEEIERFMERGISPAQFGPRIRNIPEIKSFRITSKRKSQMAEYDDFDFRGDSYETTDFDDDEHLTQNIIVTNEFLRSLSEISQIHKSYATKSYVWNDIPCGMLQEFLMNKYYISGNSSLSKNLPVFLQWLSKMQENGSYLHWNVAVGDGEDTTDPWEIADGCKVGSIIRTRKDSKEYIDIGSLRSGVDALSDVDEPSLSPDEKELLKKVLNKKKEIIPNRSNLRLDDYPLLLIYRIKKDGGTKKATRSPMNARDDIIGISIIISGDGIGGNHANSIRIKIPESSEEE